MNIHKRLLSLGVAVTASASLYYGVLWLIPILENAKINIVNGTSILDVIAYIIIFAVLGILHMIIMHCIVFTILNQPTEWRKVAGRGFTLGVGCLVIIGPNIAYNTYARGVHDRGYADMFEASIYISLGLLMLKMISILYHRRNKLDKQYW